MSIWLIRAGSHGEYESKFVQEKRVYVTWDDLDVNLTTLEGRPALIAALAQRRPDAKAKTISNWASQVWPFAHTMKRGDLIVLPLKAQRAIQIGELTGDYHFEAGGPNPFFHWRPVKCETKGRPKATTSPNNDAHVVKYDGACLQFPTWRETKPLAQAVWQAKWLAEWLTGAVGESVAVKPILILPGWYVQRTGPGGIPVLAGEKIGMFLNKLRSSQSLNSALVQRIAFQLDQRCRDVAPRSYHKERTQSSVRR